MITSATSLPWLRKSLLALISCLIPLASKGAPIYLDCPGSSDRTEQILTIDVAKGTVHGRWPDGKEYDTHLNVETGYLEWFWRSPDGNKGNLGGRLNRYDLEFYILFKFEEDDDLRKTAPLGECSKRPSVDNKQL